MQVEVIETTTIGKLPMGAVFAAHASGPLYYVELMVAMLHSQYRFLNNPKWGNSVFQADPDMPVRLLKLGRRETPRLTLAQPVSESMQERRFVAPCDIREHDRVTCQINPQGEWTPLYVKRDGEVVWQSKGE